MIKELQQNFDIPFFPYGAQYYRTPNPPAKEWEYDLRQMKDAGMNTVRLWAMWSWIHTGDDSFDFSHLDEFMELCDSIGLQALMQIVLENAPAWLAARHPNARYEANDGQKIPLMGRPNTPGGGWPGLCLDNAAARGAAAHFMNALAKRYAFHSALLGFDVWNEVWFELDGYIGEQYYCYCLGTRQRFQQFLLEKYGDLQRLNECWRRRYTDWQQVEAPRYWGGYPDWLDWIAFRLQNQGRLLNWRVETLRNEAPDVLLVSHGLPTTVDAMPRQLTDDWRNAAEVDVYGLSCFPLWFHYDNAEIWKVHDLVRSASRGKVFWTAEMQAGASGEGLVHSPTPKPEEIRLWNWISLAAGAKGVLYWQWRPEMLGPESPGFGLCNIDGSPSVRTDQASEFAELTVQNELIRESKPLPGELAILVLPESQIFTQVADRNTGNYSCTVKGAYRAFSEAGYQVDFATISQLDAYDLIYLPFPLMIEEEHARRLRLYVAGGGRIISEAHPALFGNNGMLQTNAPGYGLDEVFGVKIRRSPETQERLESNIIWGKNEIACAVHRQDVELAGAGILARFNDEKPAITKNRFGKGEAVLIGTYAGLSAEWGSEAAKFLLRDLALQLQVKPRMKSGNPQIWLRLHRVGRHYLAYVVNTDINPQRIVLPPKLAGTDSISRVSDALSSVELDPEEAVTIGSYDARVLLLEVRVPVRTISGN